MSRHQNAEQIIANKSYENLSNFKYLGKTITNQSFNQDEIKIRFNLGSICSNQYRFYCLLILSEKIRIKILDILVSCGICLVTLREEVN
jgi:hypothetical protein